MTEVELRLIQSVVADMEMFNKYLIAWYDHPESDGCWADELFSIKRLLPLNIERLKALL